MKSFKIPHRSYIPYFTSQQVRKGQVLCNPSVSLSEQLCNLDKWQYRKRGLILLRCSVQSKPKDNSGNNQSSDHFFLHLVTSYTTHGLLQHCSSECSIVLCDSCKTCVKIANNQLNLKPSFRVIYIQRIQTWNWTHSC